MAAAGRLIRGSFDPAVARYMTYTQHGVGAFLRTFVENAHLSPDRTFLAAVDGDALQGFAEFRTDGGKAFLSYLCVAPEARGRGLGRRLVTTFLDDRAEIDELLLDVFADNGPALALYDGLGFRPNGEGVVWAVRGLPPAAAQAPMVHNLPVAMAAFDAYGFCEISMGHLGRDVRLGRVGKDVLRCFSAADFADQNLQAAARKAFPSLRDALFIMPGNERDAAPPGATIVNTSVRLILTRSTLRPPRTLT